MQEEERQFLPRFQKGHILPIVLPAGRARCDPAGTQTALGEAGMPRVFLSPDDLPGIDPAGYSFGTQGGREARRPPGRTMRTQVNAVGVSALFGALCRKEFFWIPKLTAPKVGLPRPPPPPSVSRPHPPAPDCPGPALTGQWCGDAAVVLDVLPAPEAAGGPEEGTASLLQSVPRLEGALPGGVPPGRH